MTASLQAQVHDQIKLSLLTRLDLTEIRSMPTIPLKRNVVVGPMNQWDEAYIL